jgi:hypothetical protein
MDSHSEEPEKSHRNYREKFIFPSMRIKDAKKR